MLFNTLGFIFLFLPVTLAGFYLSKKFVGRDAALLWLTLASLCFYGWWNPVYLLLISGSIATNYVLGRGIARSAGDRRRGLLILGILFNLGLLGYFKYANFLVEVTAAGTGLDVALQPIVLPLAISFFTFQQITYLVDSYRADVTAHRWYHYCLFVLFFPQLIAGPIVHQRDMLPQFLKESNSDALASRLAIGLSIFAIGLFKKVVLADTLASIADPVFTAADQGFDPTLAEAWIGSLAYTFQLYFDFSGYSDMAIGLALLFGIHLPVNFMSPYKATSLIDFWRRWHMTLSQFLRDYVYLPLGGNRLGKLKRYRNLLVTMLLGGIWHGAGWTFFFWGVYHGVGLVINHAWRALTANVSFLAQSAAWRRCAQLLTFLSWALSLVLFRSETLPGAMRIWSAMISPQGPPLSLDYLVYLRQSGYFEFMDVIAPGTGAIALCAALLGLCALICLILPSVAELFALGGATTASAAGRVWAWRSSWAWGAFAAALSALSLLGLTEASAFLYFQF
jgi:D-alanyl-lipoteichoic acid acyltransferase DltB (MBOAT superfamily)